MENEYISVNTIKQKLYKLVECDKIKNLEIVTVEEYVNCNLDVSITTSLYFKSVNKGNNYIFKIIVGGYDGTIRYPGEFSWAMHQVTSQEDLALYMRQLDDIGKESMHE